MNWLTTFRWPSRSRQSELSELSILYIITTSLLRLQAGLFGRWGVETMWKQSGNIFFLAR